MTDTIEVAIDLRGRTIEAGTARIERRRATITTAFTYSPGYLADPDAYPIDPALPFDSKGGVVSGLPGAFADCAPDRWGRRLIAKRIRAAERGTPRSIGEVDYLLGVSDVTRQGALRFRRTGSTAFENVEVGVPKQVRLPELLNAADQVARDDADDATRLSAIKVLLNAGTGTLGGARPKASVIGDDGLLYIAKFPHPHDEWDVMTWEKTALDLAERAGIDVPHRVLATVSGRSVLLLERFDRRGGERVGYMSAMTLVQGDDGGAYDYIDLGGELADVSASADDDLEETWRRMAFSVAIHNTDDHLRNHGFLRDEGGWRLSPIFDVNPNPDITEERATAIAGATAAADEVDALLLVAPDFGLSESRAHEVLAEVAGATSVWRDVAGANGVNSSEVRRFEAAFDGLRERLAPAADART
jgi:serine/threonine-protein kinase HipA